MSESRWARVAEVGSMRALRFAGWFHRTFGRWPMLGLLGLTALYYYQRNPVARRGSRQYLERLARTSEGLAALGRPPDRRMVLRHIYEFAVSIYDRMVVWGGAADAMSVEHDGSALAFELAGSGRGALLFGAHLGSFDMLGLLSRRYELPVSVVAYFGNAQRINSFLESLGPEGGIRVIDVDPGSVRAAFEIRACLDRGELVALLADRVPPERGRVVPTSFLGADAGFPLAPFMLAAVLQRPVFLALCVATGDAHYRTILRPLSDGAPVPRGERMKWARELLERYVMLLEGFCREHPLQWFNFYPFWPEEGSRSEEDR